MPAKAGIQSGRPDSGSPLRSGRNCGREKLNQGKPMNIRIEGAKYGASFGSALAIAISYSNNHSLVWAIIHGILSWVYVIYFVIVYG
jgi:hypothetical protein